MKLYKKFNKVAVISSICMLLGVSLVASALVFLKPSTSSNAGTVIGGASQNHSSCSGASTVTSGDFISNSNMAYRMYIAENTMGEDGVFDKTEQGMVSCKDSLSLSKT